MIKSLNKTLPKSREPLNRPLRVQGCPRTRRDDLPGCARLVGRPRCIRWWRWGRAENSGSGDMQRSVAEKGLFLTFPGKFTKKTFARVCSLVLGRKCPGYVTTGHLFLTMVRISGWRDAQQAASPGATSGPRDIGSGAFTFFAEPTCVALGALSLISIRPYNHLLFSDYF